MFKVLITFGLLFQGYYGLAMDPLLIEKNKKEKKKESNLQA